MTVLTRQELMAGMRLHDLLGKDVDGHALCSCGRSLRRCTVAQKFDMFKKGEKVVHEDLTYEMIEKKYADWAWRYSFLLISHGLEFLDHLEKEKQ